MAKSNLSNSHTVDITDEYIIKHKRFKAPLTDHYKKLAEKQDTFNYSIQANLDFYLRFYFPKTQMTTLNSRANHLIIMFNGLNELDRTSHFEVYDRLGASFASRGISSVLFPTPFHLNRVATLKEDRKLDKKGNKRPRIKIPSQELVKNPFCLYVNFLQTLNEFILFKSFLSHKFREDNIENLSGYYELTKENRHFYEQHLDQKNLKISLLGYSLGGLKALTCFRHNSKHINSCILLNSGATVDKINLKGFINESHWKSVIESIVQDKYPSETLDQLIKQGLYPPIPKKYEKRTQKTLKEIIEDENFYDIRNVLREADPFNDAEKEILGRKLVLVIGGLDKIIPPAAIQRLEPKGHGLNILQISELGHFLANDQAFNRWYPRIINLLADFLEEPEGVSLSKSQVYSLLSTYDWLCDSNLLIRWKVAFFETEKVRSIVYKKLKELSNSNLYTDQSLWLFDETTRIATAHFKDNNLMIERLERFRKKELLRIGDIAAEDRKLKKEKRAEMEKIINEKPPNQKTATFLCNKGYIVKGDIIPLINKQGEKFKLLTINIHDNKNLLPILIDEKVKQLSST